MTLMRRSGPRTTGGTSITALGSVTTLGLTILMSLPVLRTLHSAAFITFRTQSESAPYVKATTSPSSVRKADTGVRCSRLERRPRCRTTAKGGSQPATRRASGFVT